VNLIVVIILKKIERIDMGFADKLKEKRDKHMAIISYSDFDYDQGVYTETVTIVYTSSCFGALRAYLKERKRDGWSKEDAKKALDSVKVFKCIRGCGSV
jgi:hypothetical protein